MAITINRPVGVTPAIPLASGVVLKFRKVTLDSSYPTGGYAITAASAGFDTLLFVRSSPAHAPNGGTQAVVLAWDETNGKLQAYWAKTAGTGTLQEVDSGTDLHTFTAHVEFIGRGLGN